LASGVLLPPQAGRLRARSTPESTAPENTAFEGAAFEDAAFENTAFDDGEEPSSVRARGPPAPRRPAGREGRGRRAGDFFMGEWSARGELQRHGSRQPHNSSFRVSDRRRNRPGRPPLRTCPVEVRPGTTPDDPSGDGPGRRPPLLHSPPT